MEIVHFDQASKRDWDRLVDGSPEAWLNHRSEWVELQASRFNNESFMVLSDEGKPLAVFVVYLSAPGRWWRFGTLFLFTGWGGGPAMAQGLSVKERENAIRFALGYLKGRARECKASHLEVRLPSLAPAYLPPVRTEVNPLWEYGFSALPKLGSTLGFERLKGVNTPTMIVELESKDDEQLFAECTQACHTAVRKAERAGVACIRDDGPEGLKVFSDNYKASHMRSGAQGWPFDFFQTMHNTLSDKAWVFHARQGEKTLASVILLSYKDGVTYAAGGMTEDGRLLSVNNLLTFETMKWAKREGKKWCEIGPYFPYLQDDVKLARIGKFKREFGGRAFNIFDGLFIYDWARYLEGILIEETYVRRRRAKGRLRSLLTLGGP